MRTTDFIAYQCVHGLGHGLMIYTDYELPLSLETCDALETSWDQTSCTGGVFMENLQTSYNTRSPWLRDDDPLYPCPTVAERHKLYCYLMVTSRILEVVGGDWQQTVDWCRKAEPAWIATCFQSLGRDASRPLAPGPGRGHPHLLARREHGRRMHLRSRTRHHEHGCRRTTIGWILLGSAGKPPRRLLQRHRHDPRRLRA